MDSGERARRRRGQPRRADDLYHEAWRHINRIKDKHFPDHTLVGWYHTHPGFGVFLSEMDLFIQRHFFDQPFQVAVVIETKAREEGCFVWKRGEPSPLAQYWVGSRAIDLTGGPAGTSTAGRRTVTTPLKGTNYPSSTSRAASACWR